MRSISIFMFVGFSLLSLEKATAQTFPKERWQKVERPDFYGWNSEKLEALEEYTIDSTATTGMMIVHKGKVIYEYGNTSENSYIASCRKSILSMLFGKYVADGTIDLNETVEELGIAESEDLLDIEKTATVGDIISARSGIFLPAANPGDMQQFGPNRGTVVPGEFWLYNNWDFNMAGYIFEKKTGKNIYDEIETQLANPLGMQDWNRSLQKKDGSLVQSDAMAYHMWFSARDMARLGLLMLNKGNWDGKQVIESRWVKEMTSPKSTVEELEKVYPFEEQNGVKTSYGYMWWLWEKPGNSALKNVYSAQGAWGQNISVIPELDLVIVIKTNDLYQRQKGDHYRMIEEIANAYSPELAEEFADVTRSLEKGKMSEFSNNFIKTKYQSRGLDLETIFNQMGYDYIENKEYDNAVEIFNLNVKLHPEAWNLYDSQGEGYYLIGEYEKALTAYKKTIELNVDNLGSNNDRVQYICKRIEKKLMSQKEE